MKTVTMMTVLAGLCLSVQTAYAQKSFTKAEWVAFEKAKWEKNGWTWDQAKVESNFEEIDVNKDGLADGKERKVWFEKKMAEKAKSK